MSFCPSGSSENAFSSGRVFWRCLFVRTCASHSHEKTCLLSASGTQKDIIFSPRRHLFVRTILRTPGEQQRKLKKSIRSRPFCSITGAAAGVFLRGTTTSKTSFCAVPRLRNQLFVPVLYHSHTRRHAVFSLVPKELLLSVRCKLTMLCLLLLSEKTCTNAEMYFLHGTTASELQRCIFARNRVFEDVFWHGTASSKMSFRTEPRLRSCLFALNHVFTIM